MEIIYFDCGMGAAGDMLAAALLELVPDKNKVIDKINSLNIPGINVSYKPSQKCGITGTEFSVKIYGTEEQTDNSSAHSHEQEHIHMHCNHVHDGKANHNHVHSHTSLHDINQIVNGMALPQKVKNDIIEIRGIKIDKTARRIWVNGEEKTFTTKEFDLLTFLAENPNRVFTKAELFRQIWDMESVGDIATVTVHIKKIREKIEFNTAKPQYIETIWGVGYRFKV